MNTYKTYETERLWLRPVSEKDDSFILELMNTPKWMQFIGDRNVRTSEEARAYIKSKMLPQLEKLGYSNYVVVRKSDHAKMGSCGLYDREGLDGIDIGFAFLPEYEKKGYAFEAAHKMIVLASEEFGIEQVNAITSKDNVSSQKLLEKLGLELKGTTKLPDDDDEVLLYKLNLK